MIALLAALEAYLKIDEYGIRIVGADWVEDGLELTLSVTYHHECEAELWTISCKDVLEESLHSEWVTDLDVSTHSPLLKPFLEPNISLMFSKNEIAPEVLFGIVCSCCIDMMGRPDYIARFLNGEPTAGGICSSSFGLLGNFPASVAERILEALKDKPIQINALAGSTLPPSRAQVLKIGESYVIAERFNARRR